MYNFYIMKDELKAEDCNSTYYSHFKFLNEYFEKYEKEFQMEEFLGKLWF